MTLPPFVRALIVVAAAAAATPAAADSCPRAPAMPVELPWMTCPTEVTVPVCLRGCIKTVERVNLTYDGDAGDVGKRWITALDQAGWKITMVPVTIGASPKAGDPVIIIEARSGHDRATTTVTLGAPKKGVARTVLEIVFTPA